MLEAKDQGHRLNCSQKKVFKIFFQAISKRGKQKRSTQIFREVSGVFLHNFKNKQIPTIVGTDSNSHRTVRGSSDINPRGEDLPAYCVSADLNFCNVGNKPTFRTKTREEVLDLTLVNRCAWDLIVGWHVSNMLSFSNHMYIYYYFRITCILRSRLKAECAFNLDLNIHVSKCSMLKCFECFAKMFRNVRRTCWNKYEDEPEQNLNEQILPPLPVPSSTKDIDELANKVHSVITKSYEDACLMRKSLRIKDNIWLNSDLASLRKEARRAWRKAFKTKQEKDWEAQKLALVYFKKAV